MEKSPKVLIIEDEPKIAEVIDAYLKTNNFDTMIAPDGEKGIQLFESFKPHLVILDLMLPIISGEEICSYIRKQSRVPIIMLTAKSSEDDKIQGLHLGADDYITKPFSPRELIARVNTILRRCSEEPQPLFDFMSWNQGDLEVDFAGYIVKKSGTTIHLTPNEFKLLSIMAKYPNKTFTRDDLIEVAFGIDFEGFDRTIDSHIKNLRSKIETDSSNPIYILTVRGVGYKFGGIK